MICKSLAVAAVILTVVPAVGLAQSEGTSQPQIAEQARVKQARADLTTCRAVMRELCKNVKPGHGRRTQCLVAHLDEFPTICAGALRAIELRRAQRAHLSACSTDMETLCANVPRGRKAVVPCLQQNQAKLSPQCASALAQLLQPINTGPNKTSPEQLPGKPWDSE
jgi:hypothetical protein